MRLEVRGALGDVGLDELDDERLVAAGAIAELGEHRLIEDGRVVDVHPIGASPWLGAPAVR